MGRDTVSTEFEGGVCRGQRTAREPVRHRPTPSIVAPVSKYSSPSMVTHVALRRRIRSTRASAASVPSPESPALRNSRACNSIVRSRIGYLSAGRCPNTVALEGGCCGVRVWISQDPSLNRTSVRRTRSTYRNRRSSAMEDVTVATVSPSTKSSHSFDLAPRRTSHVSCTNPGRSAPRCRDRSPLNIAPIAASDQHRPPTITPSSTRHLPISAHMGCAASSKVKELSSRTR